MDLEFKEDADVVTITINGNIEMASIGNFKERLFEISQATNKNIDIDLLNVNYIDSSGLGILINLLKLQKKKGKNINIKKASAKVFDVLKLSSLSDSFGL